MQSIWQTLKNSKKPFFALAPLDDVTDTVFRRVVEKAGAPDLYFSEFTSADAFVCGGAAVVEPKLRFTDSERPLIAQIWGKQPEYFSKLAHHVAQMGFDGIDINMGCPEKNIVRNGCCSALILEPARAGDIIAAVKEGAGDLPVSVKTRIGFDSIATEQWAGFLLEQKLAGLTIHGRTTKQMSKVAANWDEIAKVVKLRDQLAPETVIVGNGDVNSRAVGNELAAKSGVDGVMIGRGIFSDIFVFDQSREAHSVADRLELLQYHLDLHQQQWSSVKRFEPLRKFFKIYVSGFDGAAKLRAELMECTTHEAATTIISRQLELLQIKTPVHQV